MRARRRRASRRNAKVGLGPLLLLVTCLVSVACDGAMIELPSAVAAGGGTVAPTVIFLASAPQEALPPEEAAAWAWLDGRSDLDARLVPFIDLPDELLPPGAILWWHYAAEEALPSIAVRRETLRAVQNHLRGGGNLLLTLIAASYTVPLEIESAPPDVVSRHAHLIAASDETAGYQSRGHPLLTRFWGGVLPFADTAYRATAAAAYSGERWPVEGHVWAVHKSDAGIDPSYKIGVEYRDVYGTGASVVTLGAHLYFADAGNRNRAQLEQLVIDALRYLDRQAPAAPPGAALAPPQDPEEAITARSARRYWEPTPAAFVAEDPPPTELPPMADPATALNLVERSRSGIEVARYDDRSPFTLTSPRALLRGSQTGRIDEFRVHPQLLAEQLRIGIVRPERGVTWLDSGGGSHTFTARPEGDELHYNDGEIELRVHLAVDRRYPALVALLTVRSPAPVDIIATWRARAGSPLPAGEAPLGDRVIGWDDGAQAFVWRSGDGFAAKGGFGRPTPRRVLGFRPDSDLDDGGLVLGAPAAPDGAAASDVVAEETAASAETAATPGPVQDAPRDLSSVALQVHLTPAPGREALLPLVIVGGPTTEVNVERAFAELIAAPGRPWVDNAEYYRDFLDRRTLGILAPDRAVDNTFAVEDAFKWAKVGIEALRVDLPGVGSGIASGFGAGGPAAPWVAHVGALGGSGALWAAMAADAYGDRELAAATLRMMARFQAVDGRVPDQIGTAGELVENSAAPTALFLVALDNHLRTWGDRELLSELWPAAQAGIDYLFAADRTGDGMVDAVSRRDRWSDDSAVQTPIDLAALWGAALDAAERLATLSGDTVRATRARSALDALRPILNDPFWNPGERRFNFAKRVDGSFVPVSTVLPAVPMIFGLLDTGPASAALDAFSGAGFTRDWGIGLIGVPADPVAGAAEATAPSPSTVPPTGLPATAADMVTPVFTGWTALAEYANHRAEAGFTHTVTNLLLLQQGDPGYATAAFDPTGFVARADVAQGAAAQAMTLLPVVWGMLGIRPDALNRSISITPQLPAGWNRMVWSRVVVDEVRVGDSEFRLQVRSSPTQLQFRVYGWRGPRDIELRFTAHVPAEVAIALAPEMSGFEIVGDTVQEETGRRASTVAVRPTADAAESIVAFNHDRYPRVLPPSPLVAGPNQASGGLRLVRTGYNGGVLGILAEGLPGQTYTLRVATPWNVSQVTGVPGARVTGFAEGIATISVTIPGSGSRYRPIDLEVSFAR